MSKLRDRRHRHDVFHRRAKQEGFVARSAFKLEEIDERHHVIGAGARVLDLGCRPGSWLQYAGRVAGPHAALVGIDRQPLDAGVPGARVVVGDAFEVPIETLLGDLKAFDVVLSDMAPDTSGIRSMDQARSEALFERALDIAIATLAPGGAFVGKLFQGPAFQALMKRCRAAFAQVATQKPRSSRPESIELYVVAKGKR